jgi:hypothetical protein
MRSTEQVIAGRPFDRFAGPDTIAAVQAQKILFDETRSHGEKVRL